jgi:hypothetical protein
MNHRIASLAALLATVVLGACSQVPQTYAEKASRAGHRQCAAGRAALAGAD